MYKMTNKRYILIDFFIKICMWWHNTKTLTKMRTDIGLYQIKICKQKSVSSEFNQDYNSTNWGTLNF